jgi:hypothetical protein
MSGRKRYYKLDEVGFVGSQEKRTTSEVQKDSLKAAKAIKKLKSLDAKSNRSKKVVSH